MSVARVYSNPAPCAGFSSPKAERPSHADTRVSEVSSVLTKRKSAEPLAKRQVTCLPNSATLAVSLVMHLMVVGLFVFVAVMCINPITAIAIGAGGLLYGVMMCRWWHMTKGQGSAQDNMLLSMLATAGIAHTARAITWGVASAIPLWLGIAAPILGTALLAGIIYYNEKSAREVAAQQKKITKE